MLIIDSERAKIREHDIRRLAAREELAKWVAENEQNCTYYETDGLPMIEQMRMIGKPLTHQEFEAKLKKLNPSVQFMFVTGSLFCPHKKLVLNGRELDGTIYPIGTISERSIWRIEEEETPDDLYDPNFKVPHVSEFGAAEWCPIEGYEALWEPEGRGIGRWKKTDETLRPGWTKRPKRWGEKRRGWRTILIRGVLMHLWTPWQVETEFSVAQTPEWRRYLGKNSAYN